MSLTVGELNAYLRLDDGTFTRALDVAGSKFQRFKSRIDVQLGELEHSLKGMAAEVKITADVKPAEADVKAFVRRMNALKISINVNVSIVAALARLQEIENRITDVNGLRASVSVRLESADTLAALNSIMLLIRRIDTSHPSFTATANTARAEASLRSLDRSASDAGNNSALGRMTGVLSSIGSAAMGAAGSLAGTASSAALIAGALGSAIPVAAGLAAALVNIAPAAAAGATAVFALAGAVGAIKLGTGGIGAAFKAAFAPAVSGGGSAAKSASRAASAIRAVKDATTQAGYANQAAARTVSDAERQVTQAQKAARQAQLDLNDAREQAVRDLEDLNDQLADARLDERGATQDVTTALEELQAARAAGTGPGDDLDALQLNYDRAVQALKEAQEQTQRLSDDTAEANKSGVEGSKTVTDAKQKIVDANQATADQERALSDARVQQTRTAAQGQENIQKAVEALNAASKSAGGGGGGVDALGQALAKLSPNARAFVEQVIALRGAWTSMQQAIQQRLFDGLAGSLKTTAAAVLPVLRTGLVDSAGALNLMAKGAMAAATQVAKDGTLGKAMAEASTGLKNLSGLPGVFVKGLTQIAAAGGPAFERLTKAGGNAVASIGRALDSSFKDGSMTKAIDQAIGLLKQMGRIAGNIFSVLGSLFTAANTSGAGFLNTLETITKALADAFKSTAVQDGLKALFKTMALIATTAGPLLIQALELIGPVLTALAPPVQALVTALGSALGPVLNAVAPLLQTLGTTLVPLLTLAVQALGPVITALTGPLGVVVTALGTGLRPIVTALGPVLLAAAVAVGQMATAFAPLLPVVGEMVAALGPLLTPVIKLVGQLFAGLAPVLAQLGASLLPPFAKVVQTAAAAFKLLAPVLDSAVQQLGSKGLTPIITALSSVIGQMVSQYAPLFLNMFAQLLPVIPVLIPVVVQLAQSLAQILLALAPLLPQLTMLTVQLVSGLLPAILPIIPVLATMETAFLKLATGAITKAVIPTLSGLIRFLQGLRRAFQPGYDAVAWLTSAIAGAFRRLYDVLLGHSIIPDIVNGTVRWFAGLPGKAAQALGAFPGAVGSVVTAGANRMIGAAQAGIRGVASWLNGLGRTAKDALGDLSGVLWGSGQALLRGFVDGIKSMGNVVNSAVSNLVSGARDFFPFSPAKRGPFSGKGWTLYSGQAISTALAAGIASRGGMVTDAARALAAGAQDELAAPGSAMGALIAPPASARVGSYGPAGGGQPGGGGSRDGVLRLVVDGKRGEDEFTQLFRKVIAVRGGDVQVVMGTG